MFRRALVIAPWLCLMVSRLDAKPPSEVLDLSCWKLTLPVDTNRPGQPDEIDAAQLSGFVEAPFFTTTNDGAGVVFRAPCAGITTKNSRFARSELRELNPDGRTPAGWSTTDPVRHVLTARLAITALPSVKPHVVCAQIHDAEDDLLMIRLEGRKLFIERNEVGDVRLQSDYVLGTPFDLRIEAGDGRVRVSQGGKPALDWMVQRSGCYFKAGCYTQSSVAKGDRPDAAGEVVVYQLQVAHQVDR